MNAQYKFGPSGGNDGGDFSDAPPPGKKIKKIDIWAGDFVDGIQITWSNESPSEKHGGGSGEPDTIRLAADEYLVGITGRYGRKLDSITFITSRGKEHPYGGEGGNVEYAYNATVPYLQDAHIVGFFGQSGSVINAIGCIFSIDK